MYDSPYWGMRDDFTPPGFPYFEYILRGMAL